MRRPEQTSKRVASAAARAMRGPTRADLEEFCASYGELTRTRADVLAAMNWWHRKVKPALASALTQAADRPKPKTR